jgi:membrane protease subunit HflK
VPAHQRAVVERLGRRTGPALEPGLHAKLPWPIDVVRLVDVERVRDVVIGGRDEDEPKRDSVRFPVIAWTKGHGASSKDEPLLLVARKDEGAGDAPVSLLAARIGVRWRVADVDAFVASASEPERVLEQIASREIGFLACGLDVVQVLGPGREAFARELRARIDAAARARGLGIEVLEVGLEDVHPPPEVAQAWESETAALEGREARRLAGVKEAAKKAPEARAQAEAVRARARAKADARAALSKADAERFVALRELARAAPRAFRNDRLLAALEEATARAKKVIVGDESALDLDLQDRVPPPIDDQKAAQEAEQGSQK